ncbi:MAG: hypothetical protein KA313_09480 [Pseudarcicella sp.]|nr:hypothetical protein [Pseudarcicella sp.]MBP6411318.1 hypothetical protein [Pseudarcicella sp.]
MTPNIPKKPPGQRTLKNMSLKTKYLLFGIIGLFLISFGSSVLANAASIKADKTIATTQWVLLGIYGIVINAIGIVSLAQGIRYKVMIDTNKKMNKLEREIMKRIKFEVKVKNKNTPKV